MAIQDSGPISLSDIQNEFGDSEPISLGEYYRGAANVPLNYPVNIPNGNIPTSGQIAMSKFYSSIADFYTSGTDIEIFADTSNHTRGSGYATAYSFTVTKPGTVRVAVRHAIVGSTAGFRRSYVRLLVDGSQWGSKFMRQ